MEITSADTGARRFSSRWQGFETLMPHRIREVLLVASRYDAFILQEEGQLTDLILKEFDRLNLRYAPRLNSTPSALEALDLLGSGRRFDMVIVTMHPGGMDPADFAREIKDRYPHLPVVLLGYDNRELQELLESDDSHAFDNAFVWTGDARILLAIVSAIEDAMNAEQDVATVGVEVIIVVEDSVHYISSLLPILYGKLMKQSQRLISEGITLPHKLLRMRARPKVLTASSYEEALETFKRYRRNVLGVISDVRFRRGDQSDPAAGVDLARRLRSESPDLPILLQSNEPGNEALARSAGVDFVHKNAPHLKQTIEQFMIDHFGFGPFIFRLPDGTRVGEAHNLRELRSCLETVPVESITNHADGNHFSTWLKARTEFRLAAKLRPRRVEDFETPEDLRRCLIVALDEFLRESHLDAITEFSPDSFGSMSNFSRIGGGSLGGKARGLAFLNTLLREHRLDADIDEVEILIPPTVVIGTELFDQFIERNSLDEVVRSDVPDEEIREVFTNAQLPTALVRILASLLRIMDYPIAVRSSSLLEDSLYQPFAGIYETYMLSNLRRRSEHRLQELCTAIKLVYASAFSLRARSYLQATPQRPEKEKMAVMIQKLIGRPHHGRFYPTFSGIAQSYNYYPFGRVKPNDGSARVALGLGKMVVEGRGGLRFCPRYPRHLPAFSSVEEILRNAQKKFNALPLESDAGEPHLRYQPARYPIDAAIEDGTMGYVGSVYCKQNHTVYDSIARPGTPLVTFASILKQCTFPLAELLEKLLKLGTQAMSTPVEIEFAVDLEVETGQPRTFACLQMRPLTVLRELSRLDLQGIEPSHLLCQSPRALGNGRITDIQDVVCVVPDEFDRRHSTMTASAVADLNAALRAEGRPYLLIGPGRWGSADPWLGIPVNWGQIAGARIIVETGFHGMTVTPSEGSHFFHNMTSFHVGYMTMNPERGEGLIDWDWLLAAKMMHEGANGVRWIRLPEPVVALIDGESRTGVIVKSGSYAPGAAIEGEGQRD